MHEHEGLILGFNRADSLGDCMRVPRKFHKVQGENLLSYVNIALMKGGPGNPLILHQESYWLIVIKINDLFALVLPLSLLNKNDLHFFPGRKCKFV